MGGFDGPISYCTVLWCIWIDGDGDGNGDGDGDVRKRQQEEDNVTCIPPFTLYILVL